jgi:hypothetical protein
MTHPSGPRALITRAACLLAAVLVASSGALAQSVPKYPPNYPQPAAPAALPPSPALTLSYTYTPSGGVTKTGATAFLPADFGSSLLGTRSAAGVYAATSTANIVAAFPDTTGCAWYADPPG